MKNMVLEKEVAHFQNVGYKFNRWYDVVWYQKDIRDSDIEPEYMI